MKAYSIPNKLYFRIGEVADLLEVKPYVLRYWETEFPDIKPSKSKSGQRLYKRRDVEMLVRIKELLYGERFTINGARKRLKEMMREYRSYESVQEATPQEELQPKIVKIHSGNSHPVHANGNSDANTNVNPTPNSALSPVQQQVPPFDNRKLLLKIKKELEGLLHTLKI
ncbi:MAG: MerR family transcriptional regulator [Deltaproteobacteria bacterium]|nr:MerR family transcriptional regulator [Deltaproteobacteria bacterium]